MRLLIHDASSPKGNLGADTEVICDDGTIQSCIGCFGCWVKTPGLCLRKDRYRDLGARLAACDELVIVSRCLYGSYSPFIRNTWDRSLPYLLPYFVTRQDETHHKPRYPRRIAYTAHFYSEDVTAAERATATRLVVANAKNFYADVTGIYFHDNIDDAWRAIS